MDPDACLARFCAAVEAADHEEAVAAHTDLQTWMDRGGFPPQWTKDTRWTKAMSRSKFRRFNTKTGKFNKRAVPR